MTRTTRRSSSNIRRTPLRAEARGGVGLGTRLAPASLTLLSLAFLCGAAFAAMLSHLPRAAATNAALTSEAQPHVHGPGGHEGSEGLTLAPATAESVLAGAPCQAGAPVRSYDVVAIAVDITLNRYLDHDPEGRMYVLEEDLQRVREEEQQNAEARSGTGAPAVSLGLQDDAIQPLTLRVNQGECLRIQLHNGLEDEPASLHIHGSSLHVAGTDDPAIATNPKAMAAPGDTVTYEWMVGEDEPESTHYFHSHGDDREQTGHGLFGAVIVEPAGSRHLDPLTGDERSTGWAAIIDVADGSAFREFALYYHEIGDENYRLLDKDGAFVPQVDPLTTAYRPSARALNYRSEPFMNRLQLQQEMAGMFDESVSYSSYVFGDPATPIMRSYLGDPVKERIIHGGSEVFHVHHVHGGSIRWRRQPGVEPSGFDSGLNKHPPLVPEASERIDSQGIGPSETFDVENECGSGGCQQSVGDFLVHCHVAHHYFAGMWGLWRVYNTKQDGIASTDSLPPLQELPDRRDGVEAAVTSSDLIGTTVDWSGKTFDIDESGLSAWVERQLPPPGRPKGYDASVLDWSRDGDVYRNEPETDDVWPGYQAPAPATRPPLLFDPKTGKLAYPFLRPHLGARPPFAPNHGPAPYLDPITSGPDPPAPGANGPASVCPAGTRQQEFFIDALAAPVTYNEGSNIVDPGGQIFVLAEQEDAARADNALRVPLAIRANAGEDCVDVVLRSELSDGPENHNFSKVNAHIHFVQFDVQASDGVIAGFNYEQSVRPYAEEGEQLAEAVQAGASSLTLADADRFQAGVLVGVGMDQEDTFEVVTIDQIDGNVLVLDRPLEHPHAAGQIVSSEFVRYRWYPDVQFGTAYFHDHVNAIASWRHGLVGALISEPPGSTYHDPRTGALLPSGPIADIRTEGKVSADVTGSFRELALFIQDENPLSHVGRSSGSAFNLRVEPLDEREGDPASLFSSETFGDPETPLLEAYLGDPIVVRALVGGTNDVHTLHVDGHWFRFEPYSRTSPPISTVHLGISERQDVVIPKAGGPQAMPGDYLYYNGRTFKLREGSWGLLRVLDGSEGSSLEKLPGHDGIPPPASTICPAGAPEKRFAVAAVEAPLPMLGSETGKLFVPQSDKDAVLAGEQPPEPLVLHVNVGDCIKIELTNETATGAVSLHADMLAYNPRGSAGIAAGRNPAQAVAAGDTRTYTYHASPEIGETVALLRDWGNVIENPGLGLYGAIVVGPKGATYRDPFNGDDVSMRSSWNVTVVPASGAPYRDFALFMQDDDESIGTHQMPYTERVSGVVGINYRAEPLADRLRENRDTGAVFRSNVHDDPVTPLLEAYAGEAVRVRVLAPWGEQAQVFSIEGHQWPLEPGRAGSDLLSSVQVGGLEAITLDLVGGAGGPGRLPGDYLYGDHREPYREAGLWGIFRVHPESGSGDTKLLRLECGRVSCDGRDWLVISLAAGSGLLVAAALLSLMLVRRRRRRTHVA